MSDFLRCDRCEGFMPAASVACPHCQTRGSGRLVRVLAGGAALVTLAACYGPPANKVRPDPAPTQDPAPAPEKPADPTGH